MDITGKQFRNLLNLIKILHLNMHVTHKRANPNWIGFARYSTCFSPLNLVI